MSSNVEALAQVYHRAYAAASFPSPLPWNYLGKGEQQAILAGLKAVLGQVIESKRTTRTKTGHGNGHRISNASPRKQSMSDDMQRNDATTTAKPGGAR